MGKSSIERNQADFLCIGSPKCGSTWLHSILDSHPDLFIPDHAREIHFFDRYWERGVDWYNGLYANKGSAKCAGEVTPHYLYVPDIERIYNYNPDFRLILIFRNPVRRCISHYKFRQRLDNYSGDLQQFIEDFPEAIEWGLYAKHLSRFYSHFPKEQILVLEFEEVTKNVEQLKLLLADFLNVDVEKFPRDAGDKAVNQHTTMAFPVIYRFAIKLSKILINLRLYKVLNISKKILGRVVMREAKVKKPTEEIMSQEIQNLQEIFKKDQDCLKKLLQSGM